MAYKLKQSQVKTPSWVIKLFWKILLSHRPFLTRVLDMGAGDGRFAFGGKYSAYEGVEIDKDSFINVKMPTKASIRFGCIFKDSSKGYDTCIGNPPYVRRHNIESKWREKVINEIFTKLEIAINRNCNLFVYFICLAIIKTKIDGIIGVIVPYEWVSRPSVKPLRDYIASHGWSVHVYKFENEIFKGVETTASITVIDKAQNSGKWKFYTIDKKFNIRPKKNLLGSKYSVLRYEKRGDIWAMRGLSPGTQEVFTLTERERRDNDLKLNDVFPCVTSLRNCPENVEILDKTIFQKYFVKAGKKCWLIRSNKALSSNLKKYIRSIPKNKKNTSTCNNREKWYVFNCPPAPDILYSSGFTRVRPKILINNIRSIAVGSVHGIYSKSKINESHIQDHLSKINFEKQVVPHSGKLKKIEVKQMNSVLNEYLKRESKNGK
ncbi:MAG: Eco57I restriction-modification methylase domain-containing protein [Candidatus Omnitrophica bacterium]|nr:Eco57I restriction-modification methylase domain-containing protein [Candidatus Omnitrophota bacterium]